MLVMDRHSKYFKGVYRGGSRGRVQGARTPPPPRDDPRVYNTNGTLWFIGVEVEQETSAPPPKKNPGSAPGLRLTKMCKWYDNNV